MQLETKGLRLRRIAKDDLGELFRFRNNYEVYRWCRQNAPLSWEKHESWFKFQADCPSVSMFAIEWTDCYYQLLGACGLTSIDNINSRAEFSLYIVPEYQGRGLAKKALYLLLGHGFNDLNLNSIWGESFDGNPATHLFEKLGMIKEGTRREHYFRNGKYIDCHLYSITRADFNSLSNPLANDDAS